MTYKLPRKCSMLFVPNTVETREFEFIERMNWRCFAAFDSKPLSLLEENGRFATLPWNKGEQRMIFRFYRSATSKILIVYYFSAFLYFCHFKSASGIPKFKGSMIYLNPLFAPAQSLTKLDIFWRFTWTPYSLGGDLKPTKEHSP